MKWKLSLLFQSMVLCGIVACALKDHSDWQQQVTGSYAVHYQQAYSVGWDTLIIEREIHPKQVQFRITKRTRYERIQQDRKLQYDYKKRSWFATPDNRMQTLTTTPGGRIYRYDQTQNSITIGNTVYQKLQQNIMKRLYYTLLLMSGLCVAPTLPVSAQIPVADIIKAAIKKVIKATDLMVQRLQNKTIALQNLQRQVENEMSKVKLTGISDWVNKQKMLYQDYFEELWKVKTLLSTYNRVRQIIQTSGKIVTEYHTAFQRSRQDTHFTSPEVQYMEKVYGGIMEESFRNLEQLEVVINGFRTQMSDGERLRLINEAGMQIDKNLADLRQFNQQNIQISIQRSRQQQELATVKKLYGLP